MSTEKTQLVDTILALDVSIGNLEQTVKDLKKRQSDAEEQLTRIMEEEGTTSFTTDDGRKVTRKDKAFITIRQYEKDIWWDWLAKNGRSDLIKTTVNKRSFDSFFRKAIEAGTELPSVFDMAKDLFFKPRIEIKAGTRSLRRAASDAGADHSDTDTF